MCPTWSHSRALSAGSSRQGGWCLVNNAGIFRWAALCPTGHYKSHSLLLFHRRSSWTQKDLWRFWTMMIVRVSSYIERIMVVNFIRAIYCTREAYKSMMKRDAYGSIINMNSIDGHNVSERRWQTWINIHSTRNIFDLPFTRKQQNSSSPNMSVPISMSIKFRDLNSSGDAADQWAAFEQHPRTENVCRKRRSMKSFVMN